MSSATIGDPVERAWSNPHGAPATRTPFIFGDALSGGGPRGKSDLEPLLQVLSGGDRGGSSSTSLFPPFTLSPSSSCFKNSRRICSFILSSSCLAPPIFISGCHMPRLHLEGREGRGEEGRERGICPPGGNAFLLGGCFFHTST